MALKHLAQQQAATIVCRDGEISDLKAHVAAKEQVWQCGVYMCIHMYTFGVEGIYMYTFGVQGLRLYMCTHICILRV